jgi:hypothetical protein
MSCHPCTPCQPVQSCEPENSGLTFPSLVGPPGPPGGPGTYVLSLAELRALDPSEFPTGYAANVIGHTQPNDGGGGVFAYAPTSILDDNNGTVVAPGNNIGRWLRIYSGAIDARWFGAVGNGVTDDSIPLQAAIDWIESLPAGGVLYLPGATYLISAPLAISGLVSFALQGDGYGPGGTVLEVLGAIEGLFLGDGAADRTCDLRISNLLIDGAGLGTIGISVNRMHHILIDRVKVQSFTVAGVDMNMAYNNELRDLYIDDCVRGIIVDENNEYTLMVRCKVFNCSAVGIHFRNGSCSGSKIMFCDIESNLIGIKLDCGTVENIESFGIIGNYFKDQSGANVLLGTDASAFSIKSLLFQNNEIKDGTVSNAVNNVTFDRCDSPVSMSNTFNNCNVITTANCAALVDLGNSYVASAVPTVVQLGNQSGNLSATLPTVDPAVAGELWNNANVVEVSP